MAAGINLKQMDLAWVASRGKKNEQSAPSGEALVVSPTLHEIVSWLQEERKIN